MKKKKFDIGKAKKLAHIYKFKRHYEEADIIDELIKLQKFCEDASIVGCTLLLKKHKKKIVKKVLKDLGYSLKSYKKKKGKKIKICFK